MVELQLEDGKVANERIKRGPPIRKTSEQRLAEFAAQMKAHQIERLKNKKKLDSKKSK